MLIATTGTAETDSQFLVYHGPYEEIIPRMAADGYRGTELHILDSAEIDRKKVWKLLKEHGIRLTSIGTGAVYGRRGYNLADHEPAIRQAAIHHLEQHMITAEPDRSLVIVGLIAGRFQDCSGREEYIQNLEESLYCLDRAALAHDIRVGLELTNRYERTWLTRIEEGVDFLRQHSFKRICLHIDTVHMNIEEADIRKAILQGKGYIGHVHVADNDRWYPGHGHYCFMETLKALDEINYEGVLALETNCLPTERTSAQKSLKYLTDMLEKIENEKSKSSPSMSKM